MSNIYPIVVVHPDRQDHVKEHMQPLLGNNTTFLLALPSKNPVRSHMEMRGHAIRAAWEFSLNPAFDRYAHFLFLQDDAVLAKPSRTSFLGLVREQIDAAPSHLILSLYYGTGTPVPRKTADAYQRAINEGASWIRSDRLHWGVAVAIHRSQLGALAAYWDEVAYRYKHDDAVISSFARKFGITVEYPIPSLVDHRDDHSFFNRFPKKMVRKAYSFDADGTAWRSGKAVWL